jgi:hypothetical protein
VDHAVKVDAADNSGKERRKQARSVRRKIRGVRSKIVQPIPSEPLSCSLVVVILLLVLFVAHAQDTGPAPAPNDQPAALAPSGGGELPHITVTGYIIPRLGEGTQPVFNIDSDWWQKRGQQNVAEILETLPFAKTNINQNSVPGANIFPGADAVNLHSIGVSSTLVLVDGLRFPILRRNRLRPRFLFLKTRNCSPEKSAGAGW